MSNSNSTTITVRGFLNEVGTREAAEMAGLTQHGITRLCRNGTLEAVKRGYGWMINRESIERYVENNKLLNKNDPRRG